MANDYYNLPGSPKSLSDSTGVQGARTSGGVGQQQYFEAALRQAAHGVNRHRVRFLAIMQTAVLVQQDPLRAKGALQRAR